MKHVRLTVIVAAALIGASVLFLSSATPSRFSRSYESAASNVTRKSPRANLHGGANFVPGLTKSLKLNHASTFTTSITDVPAQHTDQRKIQPDVVAMIGPVAQDKDLSDLPYIAPSAEREEERRLTRYPPQLGGDRGPSDPAVTVKKNLVTPDMPAAIQSFNGMNSAQGCGSCLPPDTDGDVGPNHYIQSVNSSIRIHDKSGNVLVGPVTYNSFFAALGTTTPCGAGHNDGDGVVFYDHLADRWVVSDFAFPISTDAAAPFYQCIGVSKTSNPVSGGWWLYAVPVDQANPSFLGDYPKFGLWPDAYYFTVNLFAFPAGTFSGVRVYALDRNAMIGGGPSNTIAFSILPADLGDQYSLLPATFRTGSAPPAGQPEWFMNINSSATAGTVETQVFVRRFHVDFTTPANSTFGVGAGHTPDGTITVSGFVDAFQGAGVTNIVPNGTATTTQYLDTLGDKLMYPLVYQNLAGVESIWSSHTVNNNQAGTGPTAIRWYQFNMTGNTIPATPVQQQSFNNGADGLWRWMPSINVDWQGNMSVGYSTSSDTVNPSVRYAGRLAGDPLNNLSQGEATLIAGAGTQTSTSGRWGDYSAMFVDPTDSCTFWHTNEYYSVTSAAGWNTRIGTFKFPGCTSSPIPAPTAAPTATPTPTPTPSATPTPLPAPAPPASAGPVTVTATVGTLGPTDYATVKAAFDAINAGTHQGAINVFILGNTVETAPAVLNASGSGSASYTGIVMVPSGARTVSGAIAAGSPLIDFNGADNVVINGINSGGNSLTISNTTVSTTGGTSTIRFINGAQNNTVGNCTVSGSSTSTLATAGGAVLFSTSTTVGNSNNTIVGNSIGPAGVNLPSKAVMSLGSASILNTGNIVDNNNIFDFFLATTSVAGVDVQANNDAWTISNNRIYQTGPRVFTTAASRYAGITISSATGAFTISGNTIGFGAANGTGTTTISGSSNEIRGIDAANANPSFVTNIQGNTVSGINQTSSRASTTLGSSAFIGIVVGTTNGLFNIGGQTGNTIGSLDGSSSIVINESSVTANTAPVIGIYDFSLFDDTIANNRIGTITINNSAGVGTVTGFRGILINGARGQLVSVINNTIGGTATNSILDTISGNYAMYAISDVSTVDTGNADLFVKGNLIRNLTGNANGAVVTMGGILSSLANVGVTEVAENTIHSLNNTSAGANAGAIYAIDLTLSPNANLIQRNFIHSINVTSTNTAYQIRGILMRGAGAATFQNNMIRLGIDAAGNSITSGFEIIGMLDSAGATSNFYYNSVYIGGAGVASASSSFAFFSSVTTNIRNYQDNIFWNARSNASGAGKNYAISVAGTTPNPTGLTSNYNDLFATGTGGFVGLFNGADQTTLANWQTATGQDANSISGDPQFVNATGNAASVNLHIGLLSLARLVGTPIAGVANDFDNDPRPAVNPDIGADQISSPTAAAAMVAGQITRADGSALAGATVILSGARSARTITDRDGNYRFFNVNTDAFYTVTPLLVNYHFTPGERSFSLLGNKTDATFTAEADASITGNAIDSADYFVRQHYIDFLGREPDESGFNFWTNEIQSCGNDAGCIEVKRVNVSAAYFLSIEFQRTGGLVDSLYRASYERRPTYAEFMPDTATIAQNVIVGQGDWAGRLATNRQAFVASWTERPAFKAEYDGLSDAAYVDKLMAHTHVAFTAAERNAIVAGLANNSLSRAGVLMQIADDERFMSAKRNEMFVMMEYFGYLRRDPDDDGFQFWLDKLNRFNGNFVQAEMVKAFITSAEYRQRFGL